MLIAIAIISILITKIWNRQISILDFESRGAKHFPYSLFLLIKIVHGFVDGKQQKVTFSLKQLAMMVVHCRKLIQSSLLFNYLPDGKNTEVLTSGQRAGE